MYNDTSVVLPITYPEITSYPAIANLFAMMNFSDSENNWKYSRYIQIANKDFELTDPICGTFSDDMEILNCPFFKMQLATKEMVLSQYASFSLFVIECIKSKKYVLANVDYYYLSCSDKFHKKHFRHELFIFGYNEEKSIFYVADFFVHSKYSFQILPFSEVDLSFQNFDKNKEIFCPMEICTYSKIPNVKCNFDISFVRDQLEDYLYSCNNHASIRFPHFPKATYGLSYYITFLEHLKPNIIDIREAYILVDHKQMMLLRLEYLKDFFATSLFDTLIEECRFLYQKNKILLNLLLKYRINRKYELLQKIIDLCKNIKELDENFTINFLKIIKKFC